jgi:DNA invertase Pin-like site-specific DNA recombinase
MMVSHKLTPGHLQRRAVVYVRQSTPTQLVQNRESQLRQYRLADYARELGFIDVVTIDEDLGRSGSGLMERPGFQRLVADVCEGQVSAVFCLEASRLARNGRDWHHLIELCALVGALLIDPEGVYDPRITNDRLLLGLRGTMSEFELNILRQRSLEAIRQKASRGELRFCLPVGYTWGVRSAIEFDPDLRVQNGIHLVFRRFQELGSGRQVLLWCRQEHITLPAIGYGEVHQVYWKEPVYHTILSILTNPIYAGAYAFGRTEARTTVVAGRAYRTAGHVKPRDQWTVLLRDHHPGYISWERFELNQRMLAENAHMKSRMGKQRGRGGLSLLVGLMRCGRCGRMLRVRYFKKRHNLRYQCVNGHINQGAPKCIGFAGVRADKAISAEILKVIQPAAVDAALLAAEQMQGQDYERKHALELELEQAKYEARLAARRYEAADPDNRLVTAELEARWNGALSRVQEVADRLSQMQERSAAQPAIDTASLLRLSEDLPAVWESQSSDISLKQRIVRILIREVIANIDEQSQEVVLIIHWQGGRHSEVRFARAKSGQHGRCTDTVAIDIVRQMANSYSDEEISLTLNRVGIRTGVGNTWNETRIRSVRSHFKLPSYDPAERKDRLNLQQAAQQLGVSPTVVRRLIERKILPATQIISGAPWEILIQDVGAQEVIEAAAALKGRESDQRRHVDDNTLPLPGFSEIAELAEGNV